MIILDSAAVRELLSIEECIAVVESAFRLHGEGKAPQPGVLERYGLPTIQGVIALFDAERGVPLAVLDSREITSLRTGAATAVAAKYLARDDASVATICGCGVQGRTQLSAVAAVRTLTR